MPRERFKTLTEQMFYILLCLHQERRGVEILEMVRTLTADRVSIGSGTLYDLLERDRMRRYSRSSICRPFSVIM